MTEAPCTAASLVQALERERKYLAEELHEGLCQNLCGLSIQLKVLERRCMVEAPAIKEEFVALQQTLEQTIDQARFLYRSLYPPVTDGATMAQAIGEFVQSKGGSLECDESFFDDPAKINPNQALIFFRIAQETLRGIPAKETVRASIVLQLDNGLINMRIAANLHDSQLSLAPIPLEIIQLHAERIGANLKMTLEKGQLVVDCSASVSA